MLAEPDPECHEAVWGTQQLPYANNLQPATFLHASSVLTICTRRYDKEIQEIALHPRKAAGEGFVYWAWLAPHAYGCWPGGLVVADRSGVLGCMKLLGCKEQDLQELLGSNNSLCRAGRVVLQM